MYSRKVNGQTRDFGVTGKLWHGVLVMFDRQTESYWTQIDGRSIKGSSKGIALEHYPSTFTTYGAWRESHPDTLVLTKSDEERNLSGSRYAGYYKRSDLFMERLAEGLGDSLEGKEMVFGLKHGEDALAVPMKELEEGAMLNLMLGDEPVALMRNSWNGEVRAVSRRVDGKTLEFQAVEGEEPTEVLQQSGSKNTFQVNDLTPIRVDQAFWYAWARTVKHTKLYGAE